MPLPRRARILSRALTAFALATLAVAAVAWAADQDALWRIVHGRCVPGEAAHGDPAPCTEVSLAGGWAVLKDRRGASQFLLIPTTRVTGIEDPAARAPDAPNYFAAAWAARKQVELRLGRTLPWDAVALAVNSGYARTQDQLHIHIDCLRPDVRAALRDQLSAIGPDWSPFGQTLAGEHYFARRLDGGLGTANPFRLLADGPAAGRGKLSDWTLVAAGARMPSGGDGFVLLAGRADLAAGDLGKGDDLEDHTCALAHALPN